MRLAEVIVNTRQAVREIPPLNVVGGGGFTIYRYHTKFIPHGPAHVLKKHARPPGTVFDPFAGSGVAGQVARIYGFDYILWDLNPMLKVIHDAAILKPLNVNVRQLVEKIKNSKDEFIPRWGHLYRWHPREFVDVLSKAWGYVHSLPEGVEKTLLLVPLLKVTHYFSYADELDRSNLSSSRSMGKKKIRVLLKKDWREEFYRMLEREIVGLLRRIREYNLLKPKNVAFEIKAGVDSLEEELDRDVDVMITSPPYLISGRYIEAYTLELLWLGYTEQEIERLKSKEIPYRYVPRIAVHSKTYHEYRNIVSKMGASIVSHYDAYFHAVLQALTRLGERVTGTMALSLSRPQVEGVRIPIDKAIVEHLENSGWRHEITYLDEIVYTNYAKLMPSRMKYDRMVILKRRR